jgi:hypothetical protein
MGDDSWWTGRDPFHTRVVAEVPQALYLNYLAEKSYVAALAHGLFRPLDLPCDKDKTLFTILLFTLERARMLSAPRVFGALAPRIMQSNWRFYGHITEHGSESRQSVLFIRTITTSLVLSAFGRRLARCFYGCDRSGGGSSPELIFAVEQAESSQISAAFRQQFPSYEAYARCGTSKPVQIKIL